MLGYHRHAYKTPFKWRFAGGPMMAHLYWYFDHLSPHQLKKTPKKHQIYLDPLRQNFLGPSMQGR